MGGVYYRIAKVTSYTSFTAPSKAAGPESITTSSIDRPTMIEDPGDLCLSELNGETNIETCNYHLYRSYSGVILRAPDFRLRRQIYYLSDFSLKDGTLVLGDQVVCVIVSLVEFSCSPRLATVCSLCNRQLMVMYAHNQNNQTELMKEDPTVFLPCKHSEAVFSNILHRLKNDYIIDLTSPKLPWLVERIIIDGLDETNCDQLIPGEFITCDFVWNTKRGLFMAYLAHDYEVMLF
jgi:hypothetical protein